MNKVYRHEKRSAVSDIELTLLSYTTMILESDKEEKYKIRRLQDIRSHLKSSAAKEMFEEFVAQLIIA